MTKPLCTDPEGLQINKVRILYPGLPEYSRIIGPSIEKMHPALSKTIRAVPMAWESEGEHGRLYFCSAYFYLDNDNAWQMIHTSFLRSVTTG